MTKETATEEIRDYLNLHDFSFLGYLDFFAENHKISIQEARSLLSRLGAKFANSRQDHSPFEITKHDFESSQKPIRVGYGEAEGRQRRTKRLPTLDSTNDFFGDHE